MELLTVFIDNQKTLNISLHMFEYSDKLIAPAIVIVFLSTFAYSHMNSYFCIIS